LHDIREGEVRERKDKKQAGIYFSFAALVLVNSVRLGTMPLAIMRNETSPLLFSPSSSSSSSLPLELPLTVISISVTQLPSQRTQKPVSAGKKKSLRRQRHFCR
jgi:hypothetical protein